jgi:hypothetical protein
MKRGEEIYIRPHNSVYWYKLSETQTYKIKGESELGRRIKKGQRVWANYEFIVCLYSS